MNNKFFYAIFSCIALLLITTFSPVQSQTYNPAQILTFIRNNQTNGTQRTIIDSGSIVMSGNSSSSASTVVRANATNVQVYASGTNWADPGRSIINPTTSAVYGNLSTNAASSTNFDFVIPPSVATNTYDSYTIIPSTYQGAITLSTTGMNGYGLQR